MSNPRGIDTCEMNIHLISFESSIYILRILNVMKTEFLTIFNWFITAHTSHKRKRPCRLICSFRIKVLNNRSTIFAVFESKKFPCTKPRDSVNVRASVTLDLQLFGSCWIVLGTVTNLKFHLKRSSATRRVLNIARSVRKIKSPMHGVSCAFTRCCQWM